jgi:hypothetical protein
LKERRKTLPNFRLRLFLHEEKSDTEPKKSAQDFSGKRDEEPSSSLEIEERERERQREREQLKGLYTDDAVRVLHTLFR